MLMAVLALVFVVSMTGVILRLLDYQGGAEDYGEAERLIDLPTPPVATPAPTPDTAPDGPEPDETAVPDDGASSYLDALNSIDLSPLQAENPDVLGWIVIPDTQLSYPIVQGTDNDYYLNHTWKRVRRGVGAIFMDYRNSGSLDEFNTIIYGHRMSDNSMFHTLLSYEQQSFWAEHPTVYVIDGTGCRRYDIFASYEAVTTGDTYRLEFPREEERQAFIDYCLDRSVLNTGIVPDADGQILTLSTCTRVSSRTARWVVHGVLVEESGTVQDPA